MPKYQRKINDTIIFEATVRVLYLLFVNMLPFF